MDATNASAAARAPSASGLDATETTGQMLGAGVEVGLGGHEESPGGGSLRPY
jgi:hypothetical protein